MAGRIESKEQRSARYCAEGAGIQGTRIRETSDLETSAPGKLKLFEKTYDAIMSIQDSTKGRELAVGQVVRWEGKTWFGLSSKIMEGVVSSAPTVHRGKTGYYVVVNNKRVFVPLEKMLSS